MNDDRHPDGKRDGPPVPPADPDRISLETCEYVADMAKQLGRIATGVGAEVLAVQLAYAHHEALKVIEELTLKMKGGGVDGTKTRH